MANKIRTRLYEDILGYGSHCRYLGLDEKRRDSVLFGIFGDLEKIIASQAREAIYSPDGKAIGFAKWVSQVLRGEAKKSS